MPVEILELVVKAQVADNTSSSQNTTNSPQEEGNVEKASVQEVAEQVLEILKRKNER